VRGSSAAPPPLETSSRMGSESTLTRPLPHPPSQILPSAVTTSLPHHLPSSLPALITYGERRDDTLITASVWLR
jgi:hypothetical protein